MKNKKRILVIDGSHLSYRAFYAMSRMQFNGKSTAIQWGFLNILGTLLGIYQPSEIIVCWDKGRNAKRIEALPSYKARERVDVSFDREDFVRMQKALRRLLYYLGIPQLLGEAQEADDFIYEVVHRISTKTKKTTAIICSGDKDFRQLVSKRVFIHDDKYTTLITPLNFESRFQITPEQYADYLTLLGDKSDNIPGVPGIGEKRALAILDKYYNVPNFLLESGDKRVTEISEIYNRNRLLINLPYFREQVGGIDLTWYKNIKHPTPDKKSYITLCNEFGIRKFTTPEFFKHIPYL